MAEQVGSARVDLILDRKDFDRQIRALESLSIRPLALSIQLDEKALGRQIARARKQAEDELGKIKPGTGFAPQSRTQPQPSSKPESSGPSPESIFKTNAALTKQRVAEELRAEQDAAQQRIALEKQVQSQRDAIFRTNAALTKQRVGEELRAQAAAAREKAKADQEAARGAERLFQTNAALTKQRVAEELRAQAQAAKDLESGYQGLALASGALATGIGGVFVKGTQDFLAFDNAIKQSGVVGQSTGTQALEELRAEAERLGIVTSKTPAGIAQMSVSLSRAGFSAIESKDALEGIVRASEATGSSLENSGDIIAKTIRSSATLNRNTGQIVNLTAQDSTKVADLLVSAANNTNTSIESIGESLQYVGAVGKAANQPIEDLLILIGLLGDSGIQGTQAGSNLAAALDRLKIASAGGETEFSNLVRGSARATEAFNVIGAQVRNADGSMKSLLDILPILRTNLSTLSKEDQDIIFKALFGVEGGRAIQTLLNTTQTRIDEVTEKVRESEGAATRAGQAMLGGLGGALDLLEGSLGAAGTKFGEFVAIGLEPLIRSATNLINFFLALPAPVQQSLIAFTAFTGVLAAAVAAMAAFQVASKSGIATSLSAAASLVAEATAAKANAAAKGFATAAQFKFTTAQALSIRQSLIQQATLAKEIVVTKASAAAKLIAAAATGKLTAAQLASAQAFVTQAAFAGALVGAIAAVGVAADTWNRITSEARKTEQSIQKNEDALAKYREAQAAVGAQTGKLAAGEDRLGDIREQRINRQIGGLQRNIDVLRELIGVTTAFEAATNQNAIAFSDLLLSADQSLTAFQDARQKGFANMGEAELAALKEALDTTISSVESATASDQEGAIQKQVYIKQLQAARAELEKNSKAIKENATAQDQANAKGPKKPDIDKSLKESKSVTESSLNKSDSQTNDQIAAIRAEQLEGVLSKEEAETEVQQIQAASSNRQIEIIEDELAIISELRQASGKDNAKLNEREAELTKQLSSVKQKAVEDQLAAQEAANRKALDDLKKYVSESEALITRSQTESTTALRQSLLSDPNAGAESEAQAARSTLLIEQDSSSKFLALKQEELKKVRELAKARVIGANEAQEIEQRIQGEIANLTAERVNRQLQLEKQLRDTRLKYAEELKNLELESLDRSKQLAESRFNLQQAQANLSVSRGENRLSVADRAMELRSRLNDENLDPQSRQLIQNQLQQSGFGGQSESQILAQRQQLETQIEQQKAVAREAEFAHARQMVEFDLERQRIQAEMAITAAETQQLDADRARLQAQKDLQSAQKKGDAEAIALAQASLEIADRQAQLADKQLQNAQEIAQVQNEVAQNAIAALETDQQRTREAEATTEAIRQQNAQLDLAAAKAKEVKAASAGGGGAGSAGGSAGGGGGGSRDGGEGTLFLGDAAISRLDQSRKDLATIQSALDPKKAAASLLQLRNFEPVLLDLLSKSGFEESIALAFARSGRSAAGKAQQKFNTAEFSIGGGSFTSTMNVDVSEILGKYGVAPDRGSQSAGLGEGLTRQFDRLNRNIEGLANKPRSLSFTSRDPVGDYASFTNRQSGATLRGI